VQPSPGAHFRCHPIWRCDLNLILGSTGQIFVPWDKNCLVGRNLSSDPYAISLEALVGWRGRAAQPGCPLPLPSELATTFERPLGYFLLVQLLFQLGRTASRPLPCFSLVNCLRCRLLASTVSYLSESGPLFGVITYKSLCIRLGILRKLLSQFLSDLRFKLRSLVGRRGRAAQPGCPLPLPSDLALPTHTLRHFVIVSTACDCRLSASTVQQSLRCLIQQSASTLSVERSCNPARGAHFRCHLGFYLLRCFL
jgi:hypothetical protein